MPNKYHSQKDFDHNAHLRTIAESRQSMGESYKHMSNVHSSRDVLEESVKDPQQNVKHIEGLTLFLQDEYKKKFGIYQDNDKTLFIFWKDHVSKYYRDKREDRERQRAVFAEFD